MTAAVATTQAPPPPAPREPSEYEKFRNYIQTTNFVAEVAPLVGGEAQAKTFVRVVLNAIQKTPALLDANRRSLLLACMQAARDKLMPDGKEAVLNVYRTKIKVGSREEWTPTVQYLPMVAGLIKKLYESGDVVSVDAVAVYDADDFDYERGDSPHIRHKPNLVDKPGNVKAAYVVMKLKNGEIKREVVARRDIEKIREASSAPGSPAWRDWYDQMAIKAVIKRAYKQVPSSVEVDQVIAADNDALGFADFDNAASGASSSAAIDAINASVAGKEQPAAIEHNPGETVPPVTVDATAERVAEPARATDPEPPPVAAEMPGKAAGIATFTQVAARIAKATTTDELAVARDLIRSVEKEAHRRELNIAAAEKQTALESSPEK